MRQQEDRLKIIIGVQPESHHRHRHHHRETSW